MNLTPYRRATRPREPRHLLRWRWSIHLDGRPHRGESNRAGTLLACSSREALEELLRGEACRGEPHRLHHWLTGGWTQHTTAAGDTVTVLVVVTDPHRGDPLREGDPPGTRGAA